MVFKIQDISSIVTVQPFEYVKSGYFLITDESRQRGGCEPQGVWKHASPENFLCSESQVILSKMFAKLIVIFILIFICVFSLLLYISGGISFLGISRVKYTLLGVLVYLSKQMSKS